MNNINKKFGLSVKKYRLDKNLTQIELAKFLGVSQPTIANTENGKKSKLINQLPKLAKILGVQIEHLL